MSIRSWAEEILQQDPAATLANKVMEKWPHICATVTDFDPVHDRRIYEQRLQTIMNDFHKDVQASMDISPDDFIVCINYPFDGKLVIGMAHMEDLIYLRMISYGGNNVELTGNWEGNA
jgi:hypothetical protein